MGCDYYIDQFLRMDHPTGASYVQLPSFHGYFCDCSWGVRECDMDEHETSFRSEPEYLQLRAKVEKFMLKPRPETIIYTNKAFSSKILQQKYQPLIDQRLQKNRDRQAKTLDNLHLLMEMKDVSRITKFEVRYEQGDTVKNYHLYFEEDE